MTKYIKGDRTLETTNPAEGVRLRASGWAVAPEPKKAPKKSEDTNK